MQPGIIALLGIFIIMAGIILLVVSIDRSDKERPTRPIKMKDRKNIPYLEKVNGGIVGQKMFGMFPRQSGEHQSFYASYNCFYILFCAIFPLGCFLVDTTGDMGDMKGRIHTYGEIESEKDELFIVLSKGWGILLMIVGVIILIVAANQ